MSDTGRMRLSPLAGLTLGLSISGLACSPTPSRPELSPPLAASGGALPLRALTDWAPTEEPTRRRQLEVPEGIEPWSVLTDEGGSVRCEVIPFAGKREDPDRALLLKSKTAQHIAIPGPFPPAELNRVAVSLVIRRHTEIGVELRRDGEAILGSGGLKVWSTPEPQTVIAEFPEIDPNDQPFDELVVVLPSETGGVKLLSVEVIHEPPSRWLPTPGAAPRTMEIDGDRREATVVSREVPVGVTVRVEPGQELRFAYGLPPRPRDSRNAPRLKVVLSTADEERIEELELELGTSLPIRWHHARFPVGLLAREGPELLEVRFEVAGQVQEHTGVLIAEPRLIRPAKEAPTVLLVTSDTHRADHLTGSGSGVEVETPNLDNLAGRGVFFERAFSTSNVTVPSHASLLTGIHPRDTGILDNVTSLSERARTLAEVFRSEGFRTFGAVSAAHLGNERSGMSQGFDRFSGPVHMERIAEATLEPLHRWLDEPGGEPIFIWLHLFDAHAPYRAISESGDSTPTPTPIEDGAPWSPELDLARYRGEVDYLDRQLGTLLERPRIASGIVAVTADHGECLGNQGIWFAHQGLYTDTVHVPLILAWPGAPEGLRVEERIQHLGLGRTLLDLAGLVRTEFPGDNLLAPARESGVRPFHAIAAGGESASTTCGRWHLILCLKTHRITPVPESPWRPRHSLELFDLDADPGCTEDRIDAHPEVARRMRKGLIRWLSSATDLGWSEALELDAGGVAQLQELGYAGTVTEGEACLDPECGCEWCQRFR